MNKFIYSTELRLINYHNIHNIFTQKHSIAILCVPTIQFSCTKQWHNFICVTLYTKLLLIRQQHNTQLFLQKQSGAILYASRCLQAFYINQQSGAILYVTLCKQLTFFLKQQSGAIL